MIRLGVIGYGKRAASLFRDVFDKVAPDVRVAGIVDPAGESVRPQLRECDRADAVFYPSLADMVRRARLDALLIATRCNLHARLAIAAASLDLPLYLEKPVAITMAQAIAVERAFAKSRCQVVVSFPLRVSPLCVLARQFIDNGAVGSCEHVAAVNYVPYGTTYWEREARDYAVTGGLFLQKATHDLDYVSFLMKSPIVRVAAMATFGHVFGGSKPAGLMCSRCDEQDTCPESPVNRRRNRSGGDLADHRCLFGRDRGSPSAGNMLEDSSSALLEFAGGAHGVYTQVFYSRRDAATRGATISGYRGTLSFDWYRNELRHVRHHEPFTETVRAAEGMSHFGGDEELALDFVNVIRGRGRSRSTIHDGLHSVYACLAARQSARTGRFVRVRQIGQA